MNAVLDNVVRQHAQEAALLRHVRAAHLRSPHVQLHRLLRLDQRVAAHIDGVLEAGAAGLSALDEELAQAGVGSAFAMGVCALLAKDATRLTRLVAVAQALPEAERGWLSALGWVSSTDLQGTVRALLGSREAVHRAWGLQACAMHRVDPGLTLAQGVQDHSSLVRARAWAVARQLGGVAAKPEWRAAAEQAVRAEATTAPQVAQAAAWALAGWTAFGAAPLSDSLRQDVQQALLPRALDGALPDERGHCHAVLTLPMDWGREQVRALAAQAETNPQVKRRMMRLTAWVGDVQVVPWLIHHMQDPLWCRLAGEVFSTLTGADLAQLDLETRPQTLPEAVTPEDEQARDEDDNLPWPDAAKVQDWWADNAGRMALGQRLVLGQPPQRDHLIQVLRTAGQRQRVLAAEHLALLDPSRGVFPVAAPAWRQQRWLQQGAV